MIRYSIEKKYTTLVLVVIIMVLGYVSYTGLPLDLLPDLELPMLVVMTQDPGQTPEAMETKVTKPLEKLLSSTEGLEELQSVSSSGRSLVLLSFVQGQNMDSAMIDVSGKIDLLSELWKNTNRPVVLRLNPSMLPVMVMAIFDEDLSPKELTKLYEDSLQVKLEGTDGVASVEASGLFREEIKVFLSEDKIHKKNKELLDKIQSSLDEKTTEIEEAKDKIQQGKEQLSSVSIPTGSSSLPDGLIESSLSIASELTEISLNRAGNQVYLTSLEQVLLLLETPSEDLSETQILIRQYLKEWPFELDESNLEEAILWTESEIASATEKESLYSQQEAALQERLDQVLYSLESIGAAQGQMIAQAGNMLLQAQAAGNELTKMEVLLESQGMLLESKKEEALASANLSKMLSVDTLSKLLMAQNISLPLGYVRDKEGLIPLTIDNPLKEEELPELLLTDTGKEAIGKIYLKDVSTIELSDNSKDYYAKVNGKSALLITIQKQSQANTSEVSKNLALSMENMEKSFPGLEMSPLMDQGQYIRWVIEAILKNILIGGLFAMIILYIFLRDVRFTLLIALSIPLSIVTSLVLMYFSDISLNLVSLAGLALGVGMMVDNSIVVIENTHRLSLLGYDPKKAALDGAREMAPAITASTMTTAFVFLPILFTQGMARELFTDMALTITYSLFASLFVALTLIPAVSSRRPYIQRQRKNEINFYRKSLTWSLKHPYIMVILSLLLLGGSIFALLEKGSVFIPAMDTPQLSLTLSPEEPGKNIEELYEVSDEVYRRLQDMQDLELIGGLSNQALMGNSNSINFYILRKESSTISSAQLEKEIKDRLKDLPARIQIQSQTMSLDAMGGSGLSLWVLAQDLDEARAYSERLLEDMKNIPGLREAYIAEEETQEELNLIINREKAMEKMLTPAEVYFQLEKRLALPKALIEVDKLPLIVTREGEERPNIKELLNTTILTSQGEEIKLSTIARVENSTSQRTLRRFFQKRYLEIKGSIEADSNITLVSKEIDKLIEKTPPPTGIELHFAGERDQVDSTMKDLQKMLILAFIIIYGIMVIQFQSLLSPFIVMFTIPLAFTGGALALLLFGKPLSVIAMLGFLILSGVIVNNGIVFVDTARRGQGPIDEVLVHTGEIRIRPIFMTALTTILGLVPLAMAVGLGSEALQPMGLVIIGGLLYATLMTLYMIPVLYKLFHGGKDAKSSV